MNTETSAKKSNRALLFVLIGLVVALVLVYLLREPLFPFMIGLLIAYLMLPLVNWLEIKLPPKDKWQSGKRLLAVLIALIALLALIGLLFTIIISTTASPLATLLAGAPDFISEALSTIEEWFESFRQTLSMEQKQKLDEYIDKIGLAVGTWLQGAFASALVFIPTTVSFIFGFFILPIFLFYTLRNSRSLSRGFYSLLSPEMAAHTRNIFSIIDGVIGRYIRGQLFLGLVVGSAIFIGLTIIGIELAPALAIIAAIFELIPSIGGLLSGIFGVLVTLAIAPDKVIWVIILYVLVNWMEGSLLIPRVQGRALNLDPAIIIVLLVVGAFLAGIWGMIFLPPLVALIAVILKYVREQTQPAVVEQEGTDT